MMKQLLFLSFASAAFIASIWVMLVMFSWSQSNPTPQIVTKDCPNVIRPAPQRIDPGFTLTPKPTR
jgi:hypothetical protein